MRPLSIVCLLLASVSFADGEEVDRSPVDLALAPGTRLLVTANELSGTLSLVDLDQGLVVAEEPCGKRPTSVAVTGDAQRVVVTTRFSGDLVVYDLRDGQLIEKSRLRLGFDPRGIAIDDQRQLAYVALADAGAVAVVDLRAELKLVAKVDVGRWPRYLALSPDGSRLAVGVSGEMGVAVVDTQARKLLYREIFTGLNFGQMQTSRDNRHVYVPWIAYGSNPITAGNIRRGWVIASRLGRVRLDGPARREAIALDARGQAVGDPHGVALSPDEQTVVVTASGSHELLVFRNSDLPYQDYGGPGDTIDPALLADQDRFHRIPLGGRPMAVRFDPAGERVYVANALTNSLQVIDLTSRRVAREIPLGGPAAPSLARRGEAIFHDAQRSLDQWYSCYSCHYEGGTNAVKMDTTNDGGFGTFKTVLPLFNLAHTAPYTWHGWQKDRHASLEKSLAETMLGPRPSADDVTALAAYLDQLEAPPNPYRDAKGALTPAARRGRAVFESFTAGCANCHAGERFTDGQVHDVGTGSPNDRYQGFNTPSLLGAHRRVRLLHDGRARGLAEVLRGDHAPDKVSGGKLSDEELADLIEYLKSL